MGAESIIWKESEQDLRQKNDFLCLKYARTCLKRGGTNTCRKLSTGLADVTCIIIHCSHHLSSHWLKAYS